MGDKEMVSGGGNVVIWQLTIYLNKRNQTLIVWEESNKYGLVRWMEKWG